MIGLGLAIRLVVLNKTLAQGELTFTFVTHAIRPGLFQKTHGIQAIRENSKNHKHRLKKENEASKRA